MAAAMGSTGSGKGTSGGGTAPFKGSSERGGPDVPAMGSTGASQMPRLESSNFFKMSGMPRFGKQWLDNFI